MRVPISLNCETISDSTWPIFADGDNIHHVKKRNSKFIGDSLKFVLLHISTCKNHPSKYILFSWDYSAYFPAMRRIMPSNRNSGILENSFTVSPNPAQSTVTINAQTDTDYSGVVMASLINMDGQVVINQEFAAMHGYIKGQMNIAAIPAGMYFIKININGRQYTNTLAISK